MQEYKETKNILLKELLANYFHKIQKKLDKKYKNNTKRVKATIRKTKKTTKRIKYAKSN